ncbi:hypothetical protein SS50377_23344 [Spironucleus salmonicida]|uniref:SNF7 family protein n=1 Tax=Spironucleus salmonicida TaxID=348837 RepID=V6LSK3_9EUKA|nr:hypothetical protein SS50377_23344 [Spironucleus salmonicida]|eukprot:EST47213.1 Hypothetical protein SS50377_12724 [Spironucleus salmonicida]
MSKFFQKKTQEPPKLTPDQFMVQIKQDVQLQNKVLSKLVMQIDSEISMIEMTMKQAAKNNSKKVMEIYAKNVIAAQKQKGKILENIASLSQFESQVRSMCVNANVGNILTNTGNVIDQFLAENSTQEMKNAVIGLIKNSDKLSVYADVQDDVLNDITEDPQEEDIEKLIGEQISRALGAQQYDSYQKQIEHFQTDKINIK